jgi:hypothetical protein
MVARVSAIAADRPQSPPPVSYANALWAAAQSLVGGLVILVLVGVALMFVGYAAPLPLGVPGSSATPLAGVSNLVRWPFDPSLLWFRAVDVLALGTVVLWLGRRLRARFLVIDVRVRLTDAVLSAGGIMVIAAMSHWAGVVALFVIAGLLRRADDPASSRVQVRTRRWRRWLAAAWVVAILGSFVAVNLVPVGAAAGASCSISGGSVQPPSRTTFGAGEAAIPYRFRGGGTFTTCAMAQNRAWFAKATVLGIAARRLPPAPWQVTLVRDLGSNFQPIRPVRLSPRSSHQMFVLMRFTACRPGMSGRTFTLSTLPVRVHAYGGTQTDPVPLSQPVSTTCP